MALAICKMEEAAKWRKLDGETVRNCLRCHPEKQKRAQINIKHVSTNVC